MRYLTPLGHEQVSRAVAEAEMQTSGEIVTVLAERSDGYSDLALLWAIALAFTAMSVFAFVPAPFLAFYDILAGGWEHEWTTGQLATATIALGLITFALAWAAQLWQPLKFLLVPGRVKTMRVHDRAVALFKVGAERRTHGRTGVLIYLSMREHRAEIVADEPIAAKVSAETWGEAMADMLEHIREGRIADGLVAGIGDVGAVLAEHFPRHADDENELPDRLIEI